ncbi:MAG: hypothetical protein AABY22_04940 [Nanoarchaeota archaeon]
MIDRITPIQMEWNSYNGFIFELFYLEIFKPLRIENSLFGINVSKNFLYFDIFFMPIKIFDKTDQFKPEQ